VFWLVCRIEGLEERLCAFVVNVSF
jgi:hypothetical protein